MFRITKLDGTEVGVTEQIRYIKYNRNKSSLTEATADDAIGIAFNSVAYNIIGKNEIKDAETVSFFYFDGGAVVADLMSENAQLKHQLEEADEALIELYERIGGK